MQGKESKVSIFREFHADSGETPVEKTGQSTLIEAGVSVFHAVPDFEPQAEPVKEMLTSEYDLGFQAGQAQADAVHLSSIEVLQQAFDHVQAESKALIEQIERSHLSAVAQCLRAVFPVLMEKGSDLELQTIVKHVCGSALNGEISLAVHPEAAAHCEVLCRGQNVQILADDTLAPKEMRLRWTGGGAEIDCQSAADLCLKSLNFENNITAESNDV